MLHRLENLTLRVGGSNKLIDNWLQARKHLLSSYYHLVGLKPQRGKPAALNEEALISFCQNLVDYLSAGHFHLYDQIVADVAGQSSPNLSLARNIYSPLKENTDLIMSFHDRYMDGMNDEEDGYQLLQQNLSQVGEQLAARFTLEDTLIQFAAQLFRQATEPQQTTGSGTE